MHAAAVKLETNSLYLLSFFLPSLPFFTHSCHPIIVVSKKFLLVSFASSRDCGDIYNCLILILRHFFLILGKFILIISSKNPVYTSHYWCFYFKPDVFSVFPFFLAYFYLKSFTLIFQLMKWFLRFNQIFIRTHSLRFYFNDYIFKSILTKWLFSYFMFLLYGAHSFVILLKANGYFYAHSLSGP